MARNKNHCVGSRHGVAGSGDVGCALCCSGPLWERAFGTRTSAYRALCFQRLDGLECKRRSWFVVELGLLAVWKLPERTMQREANTARDSIIRSSACVMTVLSR